jgi:hypothetical protein
VRKEKNVDNIAEKILLFALGFGLAWALYFAWEHLRRSRNKNNLTIINGTIPATVNDTAPAAIS